MNKGFHITQSGLKCYGKQEGVPDSWLGKLCIFLTHAVFFIWALTKISKVGVSCLHSVWLVWVQGFLQPRLAWNLPHSGEWPWTKIFLSQAFKCWGYRRVLCVCHLKQIIYIRKSQQRTNTLISSNRSYEKEHNKEGWDPNGLLSQSLYQWNFKTCSYWEHLRNEPCTGYSAKSFSRQRWPWREGQRHTKRRDFM